MVVCTYFAKLEEDSCSAKRLLGIFKRYTNPPEALQLALYLWKNEPIRAQMGRPRRLWDYFHAILWCWIISTRWRKVNAFLFNLFYTPQISHNATVISVDHYFQLLLFILTKLFIFFLRMPAEYYLSHTVLLRRGNNAACSRFSPTLTCVKHICGGRGTSCKVFNNLFYYYEVTLLVKLFHV